MLLSALFKLPTLICIRLLEAFLALCVVGWAETTGKLLDYIYAPLRLLWFCFSDLGSTLRLDLSDDAVDPTKLLMALLLITGESGFWSEAAEGTLLGFFRG